MISYRSSLRFVPVKIVEIEPKSIHLTHVHITTDLYVFIFFIIIIKI